MTEPMKCVVCGASLLPEAAQYANPWEKICQRLPCCGPACVERFDADVHWLPWRLPPSLDQQQEAEVVDQARERMRAANSPSANIRELLYAGVRPEVARRLLLDTSGFAAYHQRQNASWNRGFGVLAVLTGWLMFGRGRKTVTTDDLERAHSDVERWCQHFGLPDGREPR